MRIFISYASVQKEAAERVCSFLEAGGKRCWIAPRDIPAGSNYGEEILRGIENSDALVLVFDAAANESQHVLREVERAVSKKLPIVVLRLDDTEPSKAMEYFLLSIQWLDAKGMTERSFGELEKALERQLENKEETVMPEGINPHVKISLKKRLGILLAVMVILAVMIGLGTVQKKRNEERNGTPTSAVEQPEEEKTVFFTVGDYVSFGSYLPGGEAAKDGNGAIEWQVAEVGSQGTLLVATRILAIRPFDCAESGYFDRGSDGTVYDRSKKDTYTEEQMREFRGSNDWETSDLRVWLNTSGVVRYQGKAPQNAATDENGNAYGTEAGFLTDFTKEEALLIEQSGNGVFLLTKEQVEKYAKEGALNPSTTPTEAAIAADETNWYLSYKDAGATDYIWATASAVEESTCEIYYVESSLSEETFGTKYAAAAGYGIRPAICIFPGEGKWEGDGSRQNPYRMIQ
ncbi:MAG: toll/interleukin-1 receptor domain-containing protein [Lachnospiraceae bacterium]|nr:toll/interleukin-1 receptor domain-containing protein [Lachnospiraceae bacterium]